MSEPQASSCKPPATASSAEYQAQPGDKAGSPFLCLLYFGEAKESKSPVNGEKQQQLRSIPKSPRQALIRYKNRTMLVLLTFTHEKIGTNWLNNAISARHTIRSMLDFLT
ncbi:MAG: hypothetical protein LWW81_05910 [Rhodocyclales bacterium]|nr:hypothetical protein [Rhodocyclales bacterium]